MDAQETVTKVLIDEISRLSEAMQNRMEAADRFVAVAGSLSGVGLTLGLVQNQRLILIVLPVAIVVIFIFVLQIYTDASMHIGHRQALEEIVNARVGEPVLVGESVVAANHPRRASVPASAALVAMIWSATVWLGWNTATEVISVDMRGLALGGYSVMILFSMATSGLALFENMRAQSAAYKAAAGAYHKSLPQGDGS